MFSFSIPYTINMGLCFTVNSTFFVSHYLILRFWIAISYISFLLQGKKDINESSDLWKIVVRCKYLWSVTSASKKEHIEMILVDSKLDMIQVVVPPYLVSKFKDELSVGASYFMQNFKMTSNDLSFKSTNHNFKLVFCGLRRLSCLIFL
ncbi:uncharacterized protein LOC131646678 [Vicia villosa]|uniref:uncharacterized protein LOC131646678 n=1 Tax=Vicia villosa TaxID=3911 RepID=UPI00273CDCBD|nr:uncharacterized protein LOC131646678 [Vicia villosa]